MELNYDKFVLRIQEQTPIIHALQNTTGGKDYVDNLGMITSNYDSFMNHIHAPVYQYTVCYITIKPRNSVLIHDVFYHWCNVTWIIVLINGAPS